MEKNFATLSVPDTVHKLTRAVSFSELPTARRILIEHYQTGNSDGLLRQYSCEQIFNKASNYREVKYSEFVRSAVDESKNTWKAPIPVITFPEPICSVMDYNKSYANVVRSSACTNHLENLKNRAIENSSPHHFLTNTSQNKLDEDIQRLSISKDIKSLSRRSISQSSFLREKSPKNPINELHLEQSENSQQPKLPDEPNLNLISNIPRPKRRAVRSLVPEQYSKMNTSSYFWPILFFLLLPVTIIFISVAFNQEDLVKHFCSPIMNFSKASLDIQKQIHGQNEGILQLSEYLNSRKDGFNVVALVGGTGVGKSYTAEIIRHNLPKKHFAFEYFSPLYKKEKDAYKTLSACGCNLLILENLKNEHILDVAVFSRILKERAVNYCILVLALFNTQEVHENLSKSLDLESSINNIMESFEEEQLEVKVIVYNSLSNETLDHCILEAAEYSNVTLTQQDVEYIRKGLLLTQSGCKGAYSKVQLVGKSID